jgi:acid phosphatase type 7
MIRSAIQAGLTALLSAGLAAAQPVDMRTSPSTARTMQKIDTQKTDLRWLEDPQVFRVVANDRQRAAKTGPARICHAGAAWIRLDFDGLRLDGLDRLTVRSDGGDRYEFSGAQWNGRPAELRALRGACIDLEPHFADADSVYRIAGYSYAAFQLTQSAVVVAGAGDLCPTTGDTCKRTSDTLLSIAPNIAFLLGDNAYDYGTLAEYNAQYDPAWGRFKAMTKPVPGNHEYGTANAAGYFDYFNGVGAQNGIAGERGKGYYSWDIGEWHFVALNSNFSPGGSADVAQVNWLRSDLATNTQPCTAAYFHHPMINVGAHQGVATMKPYWDELYAARADLILVGHDHNYQRYGKMTPSQSPALDGIRQIVVGTGGRAFYPISRNHPSLEVANADSYGVLKLTLTPNSYTGEFVPAAGSAFTDKFSARCNKATITEIIKIANCRLPPKRVVAGGKAVSGVVRDPRPTPQPRKARLQETPGR